MGGGGWRSGGAVARAEGGREGAEIPAAARSEGKRSGR